MSASACQSETPHATQPVSDGSSSSNNNNSNNNDSTRTSNSGTHDSGDRSRLKLFASKSRAILRRTLSRATGNKTKDKHGLSGSPRHKRQHARRHGDEPSQHTSRDRGHEERGSHDCSVHAGSRQPTTTRGTHMAAGRNDQNETDSAQGEDMHASQDELNDDQTQRQEEKGEDQQEQKPQEQVQEEHGEENGQQHRPLVTWLNANPLGWFSRKPHHTIANEATPASVHATCEATARNHDHSKQGGGVSTVCTRLEAATASSAAPQGEADLTHTTTTDAAHGRVDEGHLSGTDTVSTSGASNPRRPGPHQQPARRRKRLLFWRPRPSPSRRQLMVHDARRQSHYSPQPEDRRSSSVPDLSSHGLGAPPTHTPPPSVSGSDINVRRTSRPSFPSPLSASGSHQAVSPNWSQVSPRALTADTEPSTPPSSAGVYTQASASSLQTAPALGRHEQERRGGEGRRGRGGRGQPHQYEQKVGQGDQQRTPHRPSKRALSTLLSQSMTDLSTAPMRCLVPDGLSLYSCSETEDDGNSSGSATNGAPRSVRCHTPTPSRPQAGEGASCGPVRLSPSSASPHNQPASGNSTRRPRFKRRRGKKAKARHTVVRRSSSAVASQTPTSRVTGGRQHQNSDETSSVNSASVVTDSACLPAPTSTSTTPAGGCTNTSVAPRPKPLRWGCAVRAGLLALVLVVLSVFVFNTFAGCFGGDAVDRATLVRLGVLEGEARVFASVDDTASMHSRLREAASLLQLDAISERARACALHQLDTEPSSSTTHSAQAQPWLSIKGLSIAIELLQVDPSMSRLHRYFRDAT